MDTKTALVIEPHNDDFVIGLGGTGLQLVESGWHVETCVLTDGRYGSKEMSPEKTKQVRENEKERESGVTGVNYIQLSYEDQSLQTKFEDSRRRDHVVNELTEIIGEIGPSVIAVPSSNEGHPDHRTTNRFAELLDDASNCDFGFVEYVVWEIPFFSPNDISVGEVYAVDVTNEFKRKTEAIACHESQLRVYEYIEMVDQFNSYLGHLYTDKVDGDFVELLHIPDRASLPASFFESLKGKIVTDKFHATG